MERSAMLRRYRPDLLAGLAYAIILIAFFWPVTLGGRTLIPAENIYQFQPWRGDAEAVGAGIPQNALLSDLVLENYPWKRFILESLGERQLPLWNPYLFAGVPFLAAGQHSALYPFSLLYYALPLPAAYGWFTVVNLWLAAIFMYTFMRTTGVGSWGAFLGGLAYAMSGVMLVSVVFPMIIAAAAWLPLVLAMVEVMARRVEGEARDQRSGDQARLIVPLVPAIAVGGVALGIQYLAGHIEMSLYILFMVLLYTGARVLMVRWSWRATVRLVAAVALMVVIGTGLGAVQLVPLYELVSQSFRQGSVTLADVQGWAYPLRQVVTFLIPDFFGNPAHHGYWDLTTMTWQAVQQDAHGRPITFIFWGIKNYVEAGSYVAIMALVLSLIAVIRIRDRYTWALAGLAVLALLFTFGTPLYAILFYGVPGYNQLHSAFRWVFPYTFCMAALAGMGAEGIYRWRRLRPVDGLVPLGGGVAILALLLASFLAQPQVVAWANALLAHSGKMQEAFASGAMLYSYEVRNVFLFAVFLMGSGLALTLAWRGHPLWRPLAVGVLLADVFIIYQGFYPRSDPRLLTHTPEAIRFLQRDHDLFRIMTLDRSDRDEKLMNPNAPWLYGLQDVRGYDSIIPRQYVEYMQAIQPQGELLYNRIAPLYWEGHLDSPLVHFLNVKYVVTTQEIQRPGYTLVYTGSVRIYRNDRVLPRAFVVDGARVIPERGALLAALSGLDPQREVLLETTPPGDRPRGRPAPVNAVHVASYTANRVTLQVEMATPGFVVMSDSYFPGWVAEVTGEEGRQEVPILRANGAFRAVALGPGTFELTMRYSPLSLKVGALGSFVAGVVLALLLGYMVWGRIYQEQEGEAAVRRVAKNSLVPTITALVNKGLFTLFSLLVLRILGVEGQGHLGLAIAVAGYFDIITNFGLNTLVQRDVARDYSQGSRYFTNTVILRLLLWIAILPLVAVYIALFHLPYDSAVALWLYVIALVPSNMAAAASAIFQAHEKMEVPAAISVITAVSSVSLGLIILLMGGRVIGLASTTVVVNTLTALLLLYMLGTRFFRPRWEFSWVTGRRMLGESFPFMINNLLSSIFFRIDIPMLQGLLGSAGLVAVGYYSAAYKFPDALTLIPQYLTFAIFPLMARYAQSSRESLLRAYVMALRLLLLVAFPVAMGTMLTADKIMLVIGGPAYLPGSAEALAILIWFLPFSYINSVTQYVLIAVEQQRFLTGAFIIGAAFNIGANLVLIPRFTYLGAAATTVISELVLFLPFYYSVRRHVGPLPFTELFWRPVVASTAMGLMVWLLLPHLSILLVIGLAVALYGALLVALRTFTVEDRAILLRLLGRGEGGGQVRVAISPEKPA